MSSRASGQLCDVVGSDPLAGYSGDFAALVRSGLAEEALRDFSRFCALLGFVLKPGKSSVGNSAVSLGLLGTFASPANGRKLLICRTDAKRAKWSYLSDSYIKEGRIPHIRLGKLIDRMGFPQTRLFGKFARTHLRPLYQIFRRRIYNALMFKHERRKLDWRRAIIADSTPRIDASISPIVDWASYAVAATNPPAICALMFSGKSRTPHLLQECVTHVPATWPYLIRETALIYGLELLALVAFFEDPDPALRGSICWCFLDNNNCLAAAGRGGSGAEIIAVLVARFRQLVHRFGIHVWCSRVKSRLNPSYLPTRGKSSHFGHSRNYRPSLSTRCSYYVAHSCANTRAIPTLASTCGGKGWRNGLGACSKFHSSGLPCHDVGE